MGFLMAFKFCAKRLTKNDKKYKLKCSILNKKLAVVKQMKGYNSKLLAADLAECALFVALMVAGAYIQIPLQPVPITFQTVISVLAGLLLGWKKGIISMSVYCIMGLIGIPVFAAGGGIYYVFKPSFGYILGFIAAAGVAGLFYNRPKKFWVYIALSLAAFVANYLLGILYFIAVWQLNAYSGLWAALITYNFAYMPKDVVLCVLAAMLAWRVAPHIRKGHAKLLGQATANNDGGNK
jgi:biotin transport system substrate-specific component